MSNNLDATITTKAAARLIISNEIILDNKWSYDEASMVLKDVLTMRVATILNIIDSLEDSFLDTNSIPQFGSIETLDKVPFIFANTGIQYFSYALLGFHLKQDVNARVDANVKFGENHGKGTSILGLTDYENGKFFCTSLGNAYSCISDPDVRRLILIKLYFRIPIVQMILRHATDNLYNGYDAMKGFSLSTKKRRSQCLRKIFKAFRELNDDTLNRRLNNIYWEI